MFLRILEGRSNAADVEGDGTDDPSAEPTNRGRADGRSRYQIAVTICSECKRGWHDVGGESVELSPAAVESAQCDGQEIVIHHDSRPGRPKRRISAALRKKVLARDGHRCAVPGCRSTNLDAHHLRELSKGGKNVLSNLITLCEAHHIALHEGSLVLEGTPPNVTFTRRSNNKFKMATRAVETAAALRQLGYKLDEVKAAVEATRTHVGTYDLPLEQWIKIALSKCRRPTE